MTRQDPVSFWDALDPTEREALLSVGHWAKFAIGDRLMHEGEPANYVIAIFKGRTRICADENGWERDLAERGPGQLVGERTGLQLRVRSASVIAIEPVRALVVTTEDFSAFVSAHPRVLDILEAQLHGRPTEDPSGYRDPFRRSAFSPVSEIQRPADVPAARRVGPQRLSGQNCTVLLSDVVAFGSAARNDEDRRAIREALFGMTNMMLRGITDVRSDDRGDGLLTVVPPDIPTADVIERLVRELPPALARHNSTLRDSAQFQLRVAVNVGPIITDTMGVSGEAIIIAARLVEAPIFKEAMTRTTANLGIIASPFVYDTVIRHCLNPADLMDYFQVQVKVKEFAIPAWIKLVNGSRATRENSDTASIAILRPWLVVSQSPSVSG